MSYSSSITNLSSSCISFIKSDLYKHMQGEDELIRKGFKEAGIYEATNDAQDIFESMEYPFRT